MNNQNWVAGGFVTVGHACNCIGPQNGQPLCPCAMRGVRVVNGRYVKVTDLGPAPDDDQLAKRFETGGPLLGGADVSQDPSIGN